MSRTAEKKLKLRQVLRGLERMYGKNPQRLPKRASALDMLI